MKPDRLIQAVFIRRLLTICVLLMLVEGCQERPTTVSGAVTLDGRPLSVASNSQGTVVFQPVGGQGTTATGLLDSIGHFTLATGASPHIAPGTYLVSVSVVELLPKSEETAQGAKRITPAKYATPNDSDLEASVKPGENHFNFDLESSDDDISSNESNSTAPLSSPGDNESQAAQDPTGNN